jgi:hypothetical protein
MVAAREESMAGPSKAKIVEALLETHGRTYASKLGIDLTKDTPSPLFRWLTASILMSARIGVDIAVQAARALAKEGWTTAEKMADATWEARTRTLNEAGYARYDESTSRMLGDTSAMLIDKYGGDLRRLREAADRDRKQERKLLKECKGLGDTGVDIFFREAQITWDELYPFVDKRAAKAAEQLGLETDPKKLAKLVPRDEFPRLTAALVRAALAKDVEQIKRAA